MFPEASIPPEGGQDYQVSIRALALPFSAVPHTFVQPIDCVMPNPRPGDADRVLVPGCLLEVNLQPAPVHRRPAENLPLPPPRPDRKSHLVVVVVVKGGEGRGGGVGREEGRKREVVVYVWEEDGGRGGEGEEVCVGG